jgi:hypothetical protein
MKAKEPLPPEALFRSGICNRPHSFSRKFNENLEITPLPLARATSAKLPFITAKLLL